MEAGRVDRVRVEVAGETVEITWAERDTLLEELAFAPGMKGVRQAFEAVGASRSVELNHNQLKDLRNSLDNWGSDTLQPEGIVRLHAALRRYF